ncbi:MAG: hypothetical protein HUK22_07470, partial [Thermoguttaceae bacterium]|nr:hypothetical protein [Thermoguttaceae bacterium]
MLKETPKPMKSRAGTRRAALRVATFASLSLFGAAFPTDFAVARDIIPIPPSKINGYAENMDEFPDLTLMDETESEAVQLNLPAPAKPAKEVVGTSCQIPFKFQGTDDRNASVAVE